MATTLEQIAEDFAFSKMARVIGFMGKPMLDDIYLSCMVLPT